MDLTRLLSTLPIDVLTNSIGTEVADGLADMGVATTKSSMAAILSSTIGKKVFEKKDVRRALSYSRNSLDFLGWSEKQINDFISGKRLLIDTLCNELGIVEHDVATVERPSSKENIKPDRHPYPYQNWVRLRVVEEIREKPTSKVLVHMPTGAGKTVTAMSIIVDIFRDAMPNPIDIIWMAHTNELCEQAISTFKSWWQAQGVGEVNVHRLWGRNTDFGKTEGSTHNFYVTSFQSAHSYIVSGNDNTFRSINTLARKSKLIIVDEAHLATAPTYQLAIETLAGSNAAVLGLTATPGRHAANETPNQTQILHEFFDRNIIHFPDDTGQPVTNPIKFLTERKTLSHVTLVKIPGSNVSLSQSEIKKCEELLELPPQMLERIAQDPNRTHMVASYALEEASNGKKVLVFCPSKNNAVILAEFLRSKGAKSSAVTGEMLPDDRSKAINSFRNGELQILTNFNVLTTGFDDPKINCVILARPTLSIVLYAQMIGRGMRGIGAGGTDECTAYVIEDNLVNLPSIENASTYFTQEYFE